MPSSAVVVWICQLPPSCLPVASHLPPTCLPVRLRRRAPLREPRASSLVVPVSLVFLVFPVSLVLLAIEVATALPSRSILSSGEVERIEVPGTSLALALAWPRLPLLGLRVALPGVRRLPFRPRTERAQRRPQSPDAEPHTLVQQEPPRAAVAVQAASDSGRARLPAPACTEPSRCSCDSDDQPVDASSRPALSACSVAPPSAPGGGSPRDETPTSARIAHARAAGNFRRRSSS